MFKTIFRLEPKNKVILGCKDNCTLNIGWNKQIFKIISIFIDTSGKVWKMHEFYRKWIIGADDNYVRVRINFTKKIIKKENAEFSKLIFENAK